MKARPVQDADIDTLVVEYRGSPLQGRGQGRPGQTSLESCPVSFSTDVSGNVVRVHWAFDGDMTRACTFHYDCPG